MPFNHPLAWLFDQTVAIEAQAEPLDTQGTPVSGWSFVAGYGAERCQVSQAGPADVEAFGKDVQGVMWKVAFSRPVPLGTGHRLAWQDIESGQTRYLVALGPVRNNQGLTWVAFAEERSD